MAALLLAAVGLASGCGTVSDWGDHGNTFEDRQQALDSVYAQGKSARKEMTKLGIVVNEKSCENSWVTSGARDAEKNSMIAGVQDRAEDNDFQNLRRLSFINGCRDRPNRISPTTAPSLEPTVSPSASRPPQSTRPTPTATSKKS